MKLTKFNKYNVKYIHFPKLVGIFYYNLIQFQQKFNSYLVNNYNLKNSNSPLNV